MKDLTSGQRQEAENHFGLEIQVLCLLLAFHFFHPGVIFPASDGDKQIITEVAFMLSESGCTQEQSAAGEDHIVLIDTLPVFPFLSLISLSLISWRCVQGESELG